ncbi:MAG: hypothetical protein RL748_941 [Pseudomonadota bacterium]|jgi:uncharacterized protein YcfJ
MNIRATLITSLIGLSTMSAVSAADFEDFAKVISVNPQVEQINRPRQDCRTEIVPVQRQVQTSQPTARNNGGAIIGGIAGALIGRQVGNGDGRAAATAAGAIIGAISGDRLENGNNTAYAGTETVTTEQEVKRCRMVDHWESRTNGYNVTYEYKGRQYTSLLSYDPGTRLRVNVSVSPAQ